MLRHSIRFGSLALSAGLMLVSATDLPARAMEHASVKIHTADLDLASAKGRAALEARVAHAVDRLCGDSHSRSTWEEANYANCSKQALADAKAQVATAVAAAENARKMAGGGVGQVRFK